MGNISFSSEEKKALLDVIIERHEDGIFQRIIENAARELILPGSCVIDGGANTGRFTDIFLEAVGKTGKVYAVEAARDLISRLDEKYSGNEKYAGVERCLYIISDLPLKFNYVAGCPWYSAIKLRDLPEDLLPSIEMLQVKTITIDALLKEESRQCSFVKLDLEGGEYHALKGAGKTLQADRPTIVFNDGRSSVSRRYGYDYADLFFYLFAQDYCLISAFGEHLDTFEKWVEWNPWYTFALPNELLEKQSVIIEKFAYELVKLVVK